MPWETVYAPRQEELDACVTCGLCLPMCPTFRLTGSEAASPRGRLAAMSAVAEGLAEVDERFEEVMSFCLQCRACEPVCPSLVPFGRAMEGARAEVAAQRPTRAHKGRSWLLGRALGYRPLVRAVSVLLAIGQRLRVDRLPLRTAARIGAVRRLPLAGRSSVGATATARGLSAGSVALLAGCVQDPWFGEVNDAAIELLATAGYDVAVPVAQTCCGALAAHDGAAVAASRLAKTNVRAFEGFDIVIATAAGCSAHLASYGEWSTAGDEIAARSVDVTVAIADAIAADRLPTLPSRNERVAVQDPCHLRHAQGVIAAPRAVVVAAGYQPIEIDDDGMCCGAAGLYMLSHPEMSSELGKRKADQVRNAGTTLVVSANPGCEMQLRSHLGSGYTVRHPIELYVAALGEENAGRPPG